MANKKIRPQLRGPIYLTEDVWYYEEPHGITVVVSSIACGGPKGVLVEIPKRKLDISMKRINAQ